MGSEFQVFADVSGPVGVGCWFVFLYDVGEGRLGVGFEYGPLGFGGGESAPVDLDLASHDAFGFAVVALVLGVGSPMDGDLLADAEIELDGRRCNAQDVVVAGFRGLVVGYGQPFRKVRAIRWSRKSSPQIPYALLYVLSQEKVTGIGIKFFYMPTARLHSHAERGNEAEDHILRFGKGVRHTGRTAPRRFDAADASGLFW